MSRLPIRVRVTVVFAAVMAIVLAAVGVFVLVRLESQLDESIDNGLRSRATELTALAQSSGERLSASTADPLIEQDESFAQILDEDGSVLDSSAQLGREPAIEAGQLPRSGAGPSLLELAAVQGVDGPVRVLAVPVDVDGRALTLLVGTSLDDRDEALDGLATLLLIGGPAVLLLASLAGYGAAAGALRPVEAMRRRAAQISSNGGERLPVPATNDELSRLGETLNVMLGRLEAAIARERRFVDDASHELRTPLALHRVELELALKHAQDENELRQAIASASEEIDRLIQLSERLLLVARSEEGGPAIESERFAADDAMGAIAARFALHAERTGRSVIHEPAPGDWMIEADRSRIEQALTNMIDNALRHGRGTVRVFAQRDGNRLELHVTDEGAGMPDAFVAQAFERFSRADPAGARGGTGLGLAIVDAVARTHGGSAQVRNRPEGGADVWIELPFTTLSSGIRTNVRSEPDNERLGDSR